MKKQDVHIADYVGEFAFCSRYQGQAIDVRGVRVKEKSSPDRPGSK
jgi:hypothetical protein